MILSEYNLNIFFRSCSMLRNSNSSFLSIFLKFTLDKENVQAFSKAVLLQTKRFNSHTEVIFNQMMMRMNVNLWNESHILFPVIFWLILSRQNVLFKHANQFHFEVKCFVVRFCASNLASYKLLEMTNLDTPMILSFRKFTKNFLRSQTVLWTRINNLSIQSTPIFWGLLF